MKQEIDDDVFGVGGTSTLQKMSDISKKTNKKKETTTMKKNINWKSAIETTKTILLTALIAALIAFVAGVNYQKSQTELIKKEARSFIAPSKTEVSKQ